MKHKSKLIFLLFAVAALLVFNTYYTLHLLPSARFASAQTSVCDSADTVNWCQVARTPQRTGFIPVALGNSVSFVWRYAFQPERVHPLVQPIIYNDGSGAKVFVGTEMGNLYAFDAATGSKSWNFDAGSPILSSVAASSGKIFFGAMDGAVYAINSNTGTQAWKVALSNKGFSASPIIANNTLYLGGRDGKLYALNLINGAKIWEYNASSPILMTPAWNNNRVYIGSYNGVFHTIDATNGTSVWIKTLPIAGFKDYWPVVTQGKVIVRGYVKIPYDAGVKPGFPFHWFNTTTNWDWLAINGVTIAAGNATSVPEFMNVQENVLASYTSNPATYKDKKGLFILDEATGEEVVTPSFDMMTLGGTPPPPCVDRDGLLIMPSMFVRAGWSRLDLSDQRIVDVLYDGIALNGQPVSATNSTPRGSGNQDESMSVTCTQNAVLAFHLEESNANFTGIFNQDTRLWTQVSAGYNNPQMSNNNQHSTNPVSIAGNMIYHLSQNQLIARRSY